MRRAVEGHASWPPAGVSKVVGEGCRADWTLAADEPSPAILREGSSQGVRDGVVCSCHRVVKLPVEALPASHTFGEARVKEAVGASTSEMVWRLGCVGKVPG